MSEMRPADLKERRAFICGFAVALAQVAREHGEDTLAGYILADSGYRLADFKAAGVDEYDLAVLRPLLPRETKPADEAVKR